MHTYKLSLCIGSIQDENYNAGSPVLLSLTVNADSFEEATAKFNAAISAAIEGAEIVATE